MWQSDDPHAFPVDQVVPAVKTISNYVDLEDTKDLKQYRGIKFERPQFLKNADGFPIRLYAPVGFNPVGGDGTAVYTMEVTE